MRSLGEKVAEPNPDPRPQAWPRIWALAPAILYLHNATSIVDELERSVAEIVIIFPSPLGKW